MSDWTHAICDACWRRHNDGQDHPARLRDQSMWGVREASIRGREVYLVDQCCWCGGDTLGIYVRGAPADVPCAGIGGTHG